MRTSMIMVAVLSLAGCGAASGSEQAGPNAAVEANETAAVEAPQLAACPFKKTTDWVGSMENGKLLVNGTVDLLMAGFKPTLTPREGAARGVLALDLALAPETGAVVNSNARYERASAPLYRMVEIWCGGAKIASTRMIIVQ